MRGFYRVHVRLPLYRSALRNFESVSNGILHWSRERLQIFLSHSLSNIQFRSVRPQSESISFTGPDAPNGIAGFMLAERL